ncbi:hypothetical protein [Neptunicella marina]|uniref:Uncharacterized protein n=1 Tax=Neptunicella marina TaxID=2125989 RepID=A0A8J6IS40_9ALTE|nr:hypothetical protein [Neptunicella marina]MBC3765379.1 hypothetical protein [Neptunicella marina]
MKTSIQRINPIQFAIAGSAIALYAFFQLLFSTAAYFSYQHQIEIITGKVINRVALDLPLLQIANKPMKQVANKQAIIDYQQNINQQLESQKFPVRIAYIQGVDAPENKGFNGIISTQVLTTPYQKVELGLDGIPFPFISSLSFYPVIGSVLIMLVSLPLINRWKKEHRQVPERIEEPKLIINLNNRTLTNSADGKSVQMSNKPFCFYVALLDYCSKSDDATLNHNKNLPPELLELASRNFYRLIELGHTIRKRPDFSSNLDKMLSEIRAALDEIYKDTPELKSPYYPPKAQGEGSRSKLHNYALEGIDANSLEFIGK